MKILGTQQKENKEMEKLIVDLELVKDSKIVNNSSVISRITRFGNELHIEFKNIDTYIYKNVTEKCIKGLFDAESKGKYFNSSIKPYYTGVKV